MNNNKNRCDKIQSVRESFITARNANNFCQEYIAAYLGISQNAYSKFELGICCLAPDKMIKLFNLYEIDICTIALKELNKKLVDTEILANLS